MMFSIPIFANSKNSLIEIFETLTHFPDTTMMLKCGDYTVDAHSLIGVYSIDVTKPMELIFNKEPDNSIIEAVSKFSPAYI